MAQVALLEETRWIRAAQDGDVDAFDHLVEVYERLAYHVALRILENPTNAADATQDAFLSAYLAIRSFRGPSFKAWLTRIVVNASLDVRRKVQGGQTTSMEALIEEVGEAGWADERAVDPETAALARERQGMIEAALRTLPDDYRLAIVLVDVHGLSYQEAAEAMGCPVGTVRSRLARGRDALRRKLVAGGNL